MAQDRTSPLVKQTLQTLGSWSAEGLTEAWDEDEAALAHALRRDIDSVLANSDVIKAMRNCIVKLETAPRRLEAPELASSLLRLVYVGQITLNPGRRAREKFESGGGRKGQIEDLEGAINDGLNLEKVLRRIRPIVSQAARMQALQAIRAADSPERVTPPMATNAREKINTALGHLKAVREDLKELKATLEREAVERRQSGGKHSALHLAISEMAIASEPLSAAPQGRFDEPPYGLITAILRAMDPDLDISNSLVRKRLSD